MAYYITIDGGTTNTRICLVKNYEVCDILKYNIGAKAGIDDKNLLKFAIRTGITDILNKNCLTENHIKRILVSGMLTSEFGLLNLEHIKTPAGINELHNSLYETAIPEISDIPIVFIRGVKTACENLGSSDMMRGEETELMGLLDENQKNCVFLLPGSHNKIIITDENGRITDFSTTLTGEMIEALSKNTILKDAVNLENATLDDKYLILGYDYCYENGLNKALFKTRVLKNMFSKSNSEVYSFFMGVVLFGEIESIIKLKPEKIIIGGKKQIKIAVSTILKNKTDADITVLADEKIDNCVALGAVKIYELL